MKKLWFISTLAFLPVLAAVLAIQGCAGVGGATTNNGGQGSVSEAFLALLSNEQRAATSITSEECADCHGGRDEGDPLYAHYKETTHAAKGVTCESCHGPGSVHKAGPNKTNILTFPKIASSVVCAQCHGPTAEEFKFSAHSKLLTSAVDRFVGAPATHNSSQCMNCHSGLTRAQYIENGKPVTTLTEEEVKALAENTLSVVPHTATCTTCHNPHKKTGNLNSDGEEVQIHRKLFNTDTTNIGPGTTASTFTNFDHVCAQCHNGRGVDPSDAKLTSSTSRPSMHYSNQMQMLMGFGGVDGPGAVEKNTAHANAPAQCSKCHMPDARHSFTVSYDKGCAPCHTAADAAARTTSVKSETLAALTNLHARLGAWAQATFGNAALWDYSSYLSEEGLTAPNQSLVPIQVKRARHNYYFVIHSGDYGVHNAPYAKHLIKVANDNLNELAAPAAPSRSSMSVDEMLKLMESERSKGKVAADNE